MRETGSVTVLPDCTCAKALRIASNSQASMQLVTYLHDPGRLIVVRNARQDNRRAYDYGYR